MIPKGFLRMENKGLFWTVRVPHGRLADYPLLFSVVFDIQKSAAYINSDLNPLTPQHGETRSNKCLNVFNHFVGLALKGLKWLKNG